MPDTMPPRLSDLVIAATDAPTSRRAFIRHASALSLAIPGVGAALAGCTESGPDSLRKPGDTAASRVPAGAQAGQGPPPRNSDSPLGSAVVRAEHHVVS